MRKIGQAAFAGLFVLLSTSVSLRAEDVAGEHAREQALVTSLATSHSAEDQRRLGDLLAEGLIAGPANPLRRPDRAGAIAAYRRAFEMGDRNGELLLSYAQLLVREKQGAALSALLPDLQTLALQGEGDAAYVLALAEMLNRDLTPEESLPQLEAAAIMGSSRAVLDIAAAGGAVGPATASAIIARLAAKADQGSGAASFTLYRLYRTGQLVPESIDTANIWLEKAVASGYLPAMERRADHLLHGIDVTADPLAAAALYRRAAEAGSRISAMALGKAALSRSSMDISSEEGRLWLARAAEIGVRGAAVDLAQLDLKTALAGNFDAEERDRRLEAAFAPVANDAEALSHLANQYWKTADSQAIGPALMPLLESRTLAGSATAGLAYNAWLQANGQALPEAAARALVTSLRNTPPASSGFSAFTVASLALDERIPESVVSQQEALSLLFTAADANVGQAMLRLGQFYARGEQMAQSPLFAKRWFVKAQGQSVERAFWELAALQADSELPQEREAAERFYLRQIDQGDPRGAMALVRLRLQRGTLDALTLGRAREALDNPADAIAMASLLTSDGVEAHVAAGKAVLAAVPVAGLDAETLVSYGQLKMRLAVSDAETAAALALLEKAAATGAPVGRTALAGTYLSSIIYADKRETAIGMLGSVLSENPLDPEARLLMAKAYMNGLGVPRDARKADELISTVRAESGYDRPKATMLEADWLAFSSSRRDPDAAVDLVSTQAARGSVSARRALGEMYLSGFGPSIQPEMAAVRLHAAAYKGDKEAMAGFGHLLFNGYGVNQSREEGLDWLARSAQAGNTAAMYDLSRIYALEPEKDGYAQKAIYWLQKAAERNHPNAAYQLGLAFLKGEWMPADTQQAAAWFERSARTGNLLAARTLKAVRAANPGSAPDMPDAGDE